MTKRGDRPEPDSDFLAALEQGVREVLSDKKAEPSAKVAAITAGAKLLAIRHKISGDDEKGFFDKS